MTDFWKIHSRHVRLSHLEHARKMDKADQQANAMEGQMDSLKADIYADIHKDMRDVAEKLRDGQGGFRDTVAQKLRQGVMPEHSELGRVIEALSLQAGPKNSVEYLHEEDRLIDRFSKMIFVLDEAKHEWVDAAKQYLEDGSDDMQDFPGVSR